MNAATAEVLEGEALDRLLDAYTDEAALRLHAAVLTIVETRPDGMEFADGATAVVGGLIAVLVRTCAAAMPIGEEESIEEHASRIVGFIVDGLADAAPIFLGADPNGVGDDGL